MKASELTGAALAWAVGLARGYELSLYGVDPSIRARVPGQGVHAPWRPDRHWSQAGPIIAEHGITTIRCDDDYGTDAKGFTTRERIPVWAATTGQHCAQEAYSSQGDNWGAGYSVDAGDVVYGPTPLVAAMRAFVAVKLSRTPLDVNWDVEIDIPKELL